MRYFVCSLGTINSAIPSAWAARIIPITREQSGVYASEDQKTFISLAALFRLQGISGEYGVILKSGADGGNERILLTPKIDQEVELPEESIHRLPEIMEDSFRFCRGVSFAGSGALYVLDMEKIMEVIE